MGQGACLLGSGVGAVDEMLQLLHPHAVQGSNHSLDDATRSFLKAAENPYALLSVIDEDELAAAPDRESARHEALRRTENPYATHEVFPELVLTEPTQDVSKVRVPRTMKKPEPARLQEELSLGASSLGPSRVSMVDYNRRVRQILLSYLPMDRGSRILPKPYRDFLERHSGSPEERAVALEELEQYALPIADGFKPIFNREREDHLLAKLDGISRRIQRRMEQR